MLTLGVDNEIVDELLTLNEPDMLTEPVNWCESSDELPNLVEPLSYIMDADTNSVWNS